MRLLKQLPFGCQVRPAVADDIWPIRRLVLSAFLDPTQLRWPQFWVIESRGQVIACGQLRQFGPAQELGSLVVVPAWRRQGLGTYLTTLLIEKAAGPLYLECVGATLAQFYGQLGFEPVVWSTLPPDLQRKYRFTRWVGTVLQQSVTVMYYPQSL